MADNGYDISDYQDVDPLFGTIADLDELIDKAHAKGMKLVMDLVVNHTSSAHAWFEESRSQQGQPEAGLVLVAVAARGLGAGDAGRRADELGVGVLRAGVDLRRSDRRVLPPPVRARAARPQLGEPGGPAGGLRDDALVARPRGRRLPDGRHQPAVQGRRRRACRRPAERDPTGRRRGHREVRRHHAATSSTGRASTSSCRRCTGRSSRAGRPGCSTSARRRRPARGGDPLHRPGARGAGHGLPVRARRPGLRSGRQVGHRADDPARPEALARPLAGRAGRVGWNSLYLGNHDQPRCVSRFGNDAPEHREQSAKALATVLHLQRGTPYVFEGDELGLPNAGYTRIDQLRDIESLNHYAEAVAAGEEPEDVMAALRAKGRDNARVPMPWDDAPNGGFTTGTPWLDAHPDAATINAAAQVDDPDSVFSHYRRLIALRHQEKAVSHGDLHDAGARRRAGLRVPPRARRHAAARPRQPVGRRRGDGRHRSVGATPSSPSGRSPAPLLPRPTRWRHGSPGCTGSPGTSPRTPACGSQR